MEMDSAPYKIIDGESIMDNDMAERYNATINGIAERYNATLTGMAKMINNDGRINAMEKVINDNDMGKMVDQRIEFDENSDFATVAGGLFIAIMILFLVRWAYVRRNDLRHVVQVLFSKQRRERREDLNINNNQQPMDNHQQPPVPINATQPQQVHVNPQLKPQQQHLHQPGASSVHLQRKALPEALKTQSTTTL